MFGFPSLMASDVLECIAIRFGVGCSAGACNTLTWCRGKLNKLTPNLVGGAYALL